ncbi:MAG: DUF2249 domain-containing protein [Chromatiales bacterium]|nr:DUF2249 domain-containing protein [Chromatiales bacterium]
MEQILDVSALAAPEPLLRAVDVIKGLPQGDYLRFRHRMKPCRLYDVLKESGLEWETRQGEVVECELFIWHAGDRVAEEAARAAAAKLEPWQD